MMNRWSLDKDACHEYRYLLDTIRLREVKQRTAKQLIKTLWSGFSVRELRFSKDPEVQQYNTAQTEQENTTIAIRKHYSTAKYLARDQQIPPLFAYTPEQISAFEQKITDIETIISDLLPQITQLLQLLQQKKWELVKWALFEVGDAALEKVVWTGVKQYFPLIADLLSTLFWSSALGADEINPTAKNIGDLFTNIHHLTEEIKEIHPDQVDTLQLPELRNLAIVEYGDLLADVLTQRKDVTSILTLLVQGNRYFTISSYQSKLKEALKKLAIFQTSLQKLKNDITLYHAYREGYVSPQLAL